MIPFEEQHPEAGAILANLCADRMLQKRAGYRIKPIFLDNVPRQKGDKIGRNDPCPCGSGRKFKKCCRN